MNPFCLLYLSALAPGQGPEMVGPITRTARRNNLRDGLSGLLVFDGENFLQWIEGPQRGVDALLDRLLFDDRHTDLDILLHEPRNEAPLFPDWQLAYHHAEPAACGIADLAGLRGAVALQRFRSMIPQFDICATARPEFGSIDLLR